MISATSLNSAPSPHSLAKPAPIPIGLENGRLRVDSQKFLVPPLPVSARSLSHASDPKKRDRLPANNGVLHIHENHLNGMRRQYGVSQTSHQHHQHLPIPRKDAKSPVYNGDTVGSTGIPSNPNSFPMRSALPIPCSSPSPASSASPNKSQSPSSLPSSSNVSGTYMSQLPPGLPEMNLGSPAAAVAAAAAAAAATRMYTGFRSLPPHSNTGHLGPYYAAAAAAAAASHPLPYPMFNTHSYNQHSGNSYLENYHSPNLLAVPPLRPSASPSRPPTACLPSPHAPRQLSPLLPQDHSTSTTSLHSQLIESTGERYNLHSHSHMSSQHHGSKFGATSVNSGSSSVPSSPTVISNHSPSPSSSHLKIPYAIELSNDRSPGPGLNHAKSSPSLPSPKWNPGRVHESVFFPNGVDLDHPPGRQVTMKHHILQRPAEEIKENNFSAHMDLPFGIPKGSSSLDLSMESNSRGSSNGHQKQFTPSSPKKRSGYWNFGGAGMNGDTPGLPSPSPLSNGSVVTIDSVKYLTSPQARHPSTNCIVTENHVHVAQSPKSPYLPSPASVKSSLSYFQFPNVKSNTTGSSSFSDSSPVGNLSLRTATPSTPTTPSFGRNYSPAKSPQKSHLNNQNTPVRIEQMPVIDAFRQGALTQLPSGELKRVEDLRADDFISAAASMADSLEIINCTVISIHLDVSNSLCKVILTPVSQNQQVIVDASPEQPFFVIGRGWSSSSPAKTEQKLRLPCTALSVGDVCITLRRKITPSLPASTTNVNSSIQRNMKQSSNSGGSNNKSKLSTGSGDVPKGSSRAATGSSGTGRPRGRSTSTTNKGSNGSSGAPSSSSMLPPPPIPSSAASANSQAKADSSHASFPAKPAPKRSPPSATDENESGSSNNPKKRRWSAPEVINDENDNSAIKL